MVNLGTLLKHEVRYYGVTRQHAVALMREDGDSDLRTILYFIDNPKQLRNEEDADIN